MTLPNVPGTRRKRSLSGHTLEGKSDDISTSSSPKLDLRNAEEFLSKLMDSITINSRGRKREKSQFLVQNSTTHKRSKSSSSRVTRRARRRPGKFSQKALKKTDVNVPCRIYNLIVFLELQVLHEWFENHWQNPYPTSSEKAVLAEITELSETQISTWFQNKRKRDQRWQKYKERLYYGEGRDRQKSNSLDLFFQNLNQNIETESAEQRSPINSLGITKNCSSRQGHPLPDCSNKYMGATDAAASPSSYPKRDITNNGRGSWFAADRKEISTPKCPGVESSDSLGELLFGTAQETLTARESDDYPFGHEEDVLSSYLKPSGKSAGSESSFDVGDFLK
eukprot:jgi/Bigna1/82490/fgenesh1_pg.93_\